jgi:ribulose-bisphosphate carboxylase large chain
MDSVQSDLFEVEYRIIAGSRSDAEHIAENICIEQSVEMPADAVPGHVKSSIAQLISLEPASNNRWFVKIAFPVFLFENDPTQFLNVLFGNSSLQPGIKITDLDAEKLHDLLPGPYFGIDGIRKLLKVQNRPLSSTALKPVGLSPAELADRAFQFTSGGIDIIKDDHGLASQSSAPFRARVKSCVNAIRGGMEKSGKRTLYFPNITTSPARVLDRYFEAVELGADGVLISVQLCGPSILCELAREAEVPVMAHPAFSGSMVIHESQGITASLYYGLLWRAFGADCIVYPNARGRFSFSVEMCKEINNRCTTPISGIKPAFPVPGGGINRESLPHWMNEYEKDTIFLIGGSLYQHPEGIFKAASEFQQTLQES